MTAARGLSFTTAMGVIMGVHDNTTNLGAATKPA